MTQPRITKLLRSKGDIELEILRLSAPPLVENIEAKMEAWRRTNPRGEKHFETAIHGDPRNRETLVVATIYFKGHSQTFGFLAAAGFVLPFEAFAAHIANDYIAIREASPNELKAMDQKLKDFKERMERLPFRE
jgi:hypothetical protein